MDLVLFLSTIDYGPILKFLTAFDLVRLSEAIAPISNDLTTKSSPDFWDRMRRHYSSESHYLPHQVRNLNDYIGRVYDCIFLRECPKAEVRPHSQMFPFGPLDTIDNIVVHPTATWNDFIANPSLEFHKDSSCQLSHLGSKSWLLSETHCLVKSEFVDKSHLRPGDIIQVKNGSELVTAFVVFKRGKYSWNGGPGVAMIEHEDRSELTASFDNLTLSGADQDMRQHFPMIMRYLTEGGAWGIGPDDQMYWRHAEDSRPYPYECVTLEHDYFEDMNDVFTTLERSLMSYYDSRHSQTKPPGSKLSFRKAFQFIQEYVSEAWNFEIFFYEGQFWLRMDTIPRYLRESWPDSIRAFSSLEEIFKHLQDVYVPQPDMFPGRDELYRFLAGDDWWEYDDVDVDSEDEVRYYGHDFDYADYPNYGTDESF